MFANSNFGADMDLTVSKLNCKHVGQSALTRKNVAHIYNWRK